MKTLLFATLVLMISISEPFVKTTEQKQRTVEIENVKLSEHEQIIYDEIEYINTVIDELTTERQRLTDMLTVPNIESVYRDSTEARQQFDYERSRQILLDRGRSKASDSDVSKLRPYDQDYRTTGQADFAIEDSNRVAKGANKALFKKRTGSKKAKVLGRRKNSN